MILTLLIFLIILSILIMVHELGHFTAAKKLGIKVEEFGFGLPPRLWGKKLGETIYSINWLPIGGFVRLYGEEREEEKSEKRKAKSIKRKSEKRAFYARPVWQRSVVLLAGVIMNFLLAVFIISFLFTRGVMVPTDKVHVEKVIAGSPAAIAGLQEKDIIKQLTINNQQFTIKTGEQLIKTTKEHLGEEISIIVERDGQEEELQIIPRKEYSADEGPMGIMISNFEMKKYALCSILEQ